MKQSKPQTNTEALKLSLLFAAYLIILFLLFNLTRTIPLMGFIYTILLLGTPFVFYKITKYQVRLSGATAFLRIFLHAINTYLFGALLLAGVQYLYYEYIAPGVIQRMMEESIETTQQMLPQMAEQFNQINPPEFINGAVFAIAVFQMNIFIGIFLSLIISPFVLRKTKSNPA